MADPANKHMWQRVSSIVLMWILTLVGWSFFRSSSLGQLWNWFAALGNWNASSSIYWVGPLWWWLLHVLPLLLLQLALWKQNDESRVKAFHWGFRGLMYAVLFILVTTSMVTDQEFIYFQF
jgi:hypothetical protein